LYNLPDYGQFLTKTCSYRNKYSCV